MATFIPGLRGPILPPQGAVNILLVSLPLLILSETKSIWTGHLVLKTLSSFAFLYGPLKLNAHSYSGFIDWSRYDTLITAGLMASLIGDICLVPAPSTYHKPTPKGVQREPTASFKLGVLAFAGAHVAYIAAFLKHTTSISWPIFIGTFAGNMMLAKALGVIYPPSVKGNVGNLMNLDIRGEMRPLVTGYAGIISGMLAAAASTVAPAATWPWQRIVGAAMFVLSDMFVAKDAFGAKETDAQGVYTGRPNRWYKLAAGWGLYFWGQMVLAGTVY
ncbi:hypothetical protein M011DRAFT_412078 [Sporormia fimetaria CBS 119925]|uniref:YhhN-like protein n=1 Tax=Sporormia fimetaria CBS 119925 TaxID=1340428 RepID=A0A6A6UY66_9PLEO|nr:hypothetical protein M011DRAFT_412078 [Sporormia fimetaria CBS 119925]